MWLRSNSTNRARGKQDFRVPHSVFSELFEFGPVHRGGPNAKWTSSNTIITGAARYLQARLLEKAKSRTELALRRNPTIPARPALATLLSSADAAPEG